MRVDLDRPQFIAPIIYLKNNDVEFSLSRGSFATILLRENYENLVILLLPVFSFFIFLKISDMMPIPIIMVPTIIIFNSISNPIWIGIHEKMILDLSLIALEDEKINPKINVMTAYSNY